MPHRTTVADPRDPTGEHCLAVEYEAHRSRPDPSVGWPGHTEFRVYEAVTKRDRCILAQLSASQQAALYDAVHGAHDHG